MVLVYIHPSGSGFICYSYTLIKFAIRRHLCNEAKQWWRWLCRRRLCAAQLPQLQCDIGATAPVPHADGFPGIFGIYTKFIRWNSLLWYFCMHSSFVVFRCPGSDDWVVSGGDCHFIFWIHRGILRTFRKFWTMTMTIDRDQNKSSTLVATLLSQIQTNKIMRAGLGILSIKSTYITSCCGPEQVVCSRNTHQLLL